ncbi:uncharacterized protein N7484_009994 [Penicillium longicatenatum]|uniref:uncharacterized protein n=1 Tax=Penicillium longicatenatum TaxID=1561947 RepID=UPI002547FE60|nr:uncharacterized protein N7484_009994 [Penicillium longicatenatum]KAJ5636681.1 hypothetical protein N7484_009994 [Penicillium longicatenatum]
MRPCHYKLEDKRNRVNELTQFIIDQEFTPPPALVDNEAIFRNVLDSLGIQHIQKSLNGAERKKEFDKQTNLADSDQIYSNDGADTQSLDIEELDPDMNLLMEPFIILEDNHPCDAHSDVLTAQSASDDFIQPFWDGASSALDEERSKDRGSLPQQSGLRPSVNDLREPENVPNSEISGNDGTEDIVDRLSDRMGSLQIGSDGQVRYYGPTSHFNLLRMPTPDNLTIHRTIRKDGQDHLNRMGLDKEVPRSMEEHLINLYFTWHSPSVDVVNRDMYEMAKRQWQEQKEETSSYSEALTNAMCCLGAAFEPRYHPNFITYPRSLSDFFADRAKTLLDIELDSPTMATVQAMVVLSGHDIGCKRDARGWLYSGMAMRLAFDLGLHIDMSPYVANGSISEVEADVRRMVFWGAYTLDHRWGFLLGRPFRINLEDVTVQKPGLDFRQDQAQRWYPYGLPHPTEFPHGLSIANSASSLNLHRIALCEIMTPLGHVLYGSSKISRESLQKLNVETTDRLLHWKANLPEFLQININESTSPHLPHVLLLHLYYHQAVIHAHRPWMSKSSIQPQPQQGAGHVHARQMCVESGTAIAKILQIYEKFYTFRRMNIQVVSITCSAALMLIFAKALHRSTHDDEENVANLNICFRALEECGSAWESAKRAQNFLLHMQGLWDIQIRPYRAGKRVGSQFMGGSGLHEDFLQSKRSRTSSKPLLSGNPGRLWGGDIPDIDSDSGELECLWAATMRAMPTSQ